VSSVQDEFIDVRVRRAPAEPAEPVKATWRNKPSQKKVEDAMVEIAKGYLPAEEYAKGATRPPLDEIWGKLKQETGSKAVTRRQAQNALQNRAPHLRGQKGYSKKKYPKKTSKSK
jgi:hypothetical protein